ncbi:MAG: DNA processing protein DprA [Gammaproteobacteria bacterium]|nr:MAG: DNA processing protein DprA [Gammaproteobacteria bacterium]
MNASSSLSPTAQATLLLTSHFAKAGNGKIKPLTIKEWGKFALWLKEKNHSPADLLASDPKALLNGWHDTRISTERIIELLNRGHSLALAMEKWQRAGLWVVTRSDPQYPGRLKQRLKTDSPPVLFGCGNKALLNAGGLAVIGSRNASEPDLAFTAQIGVKAAAENIAIVSGGARGIDEAAMLAAIKRGGVVIGVLAESLLGAAISVKWRKGLMDGHTVLVSPFYPEAGFSVGNAMARNKYIYCLADSALVVHSGKKGGTLSGAEENLKKLWVPLWVKTTTKPGAANADLVAKGGRWLEDDLQGLPLSDLINNKHHCKDQVGKLQADLFSEPMQPELLTVSEPSSVPEYEVEMNAESSISAPVDFYRLFIAELQREAKQPVSVAELSERTGLHRSQLSDWLKRAVADGVVKRLARPVRYQVENKKQEG